MTLLNSFALATAIVTCHDLRQQFCYLIFKFAKSRLDEVRNPTRFSPRKSLSLDAQPVERNGTRTLDPRLAKPVLSQLS